MDADLLETRLGEARDRAGEELARLNAQIADAATELPDLFTARIGAGVYGAIYETLGVVLDGRRP